MSKIQARLIALKSERYLLIRQSIIDGCQNEQTADRIKELTAAIENLKARLLKY